MLNNKISFLLDRIKDYVRTYTIVCIHLNE